LRPEKGCDDLKNKVFMRKTGEEKRRHLSAALKYTTGGALDDGTIRRILPKVDIHRQYTVSAFSDSRAFQEAVARTQTEKVLMSAVFSRTGNGTAAVVITPLKSADPKKSKRVIYIYTPILYAGKGAKKWAKASRNV